MSTLSASILVQAMPDPASSLAVVADAQLSVAALEALVLSDPTYRVAERARGADQVGQVLVMYAPMVVVVESVGSTWRQLLEPWNSSAHTLLLLDPEDDSGQFVQAVRARPHGYLARTASRAQFAVAIARLRQTGAYVDPVLLERLQWATSALGASTRPRHAELSHREREILVRIANGHSSKEIARECAIAPKTVCNHVNNISQKLNVRHRGQLVLYAAQHGLTQL